MIGIRQVGDLIPMLAAVRERKQRIGFVPTMGALHEGHLTLVREARRRDGTVVVSVFVNPKQFGQGEDFSRYPRDLEKDAALAASAGAEILFAPAPEEIYPPGFATSVEVAGVSSLLEGAARPGHFRGVATVVLKLFEIVRPDAAYFGEKDAQQLAVIRKMVADLNLPIEIVPMPTVRDADGLALSSRNAFLSTEARALARRIPASLRAAEAAVTRGERSASVLREVVLETLGRELADAVDYIALVDPATFLLEPQLRKEALLCVAVRVGGTRLIDNLRLEPGWKGP